MTVTIKLAPAYFRIGVDTPAYEADDLTGTGAKISGGRWNHKGTPLVYASSSRALACLETFVHLAGTTLPLNRYLVEITVPQSVLAKAIKINGSDHVGWDAEPAGAVSLEIGKKWVDSAASAVALVPSVIVPEEFNLVINPAHPDAAQITAKKVRKWLYDSRLL